MSYIEALSLGSNTNADIRFGDISEGGTTRVNVDYHKEFVSLWRNVSELNTDSFVISSSCSRSVVTSVMNALLYFAGKTAKLSFLFVLIKADDGGIEVKISSASPSESDHHSVCTWR